MINEKIVKLNETDLEEVCGGSDDENSIKIAKNSAASEIGKQIVLLVAAPIIIPISEGISSFSKWFFGRLTKKLDKKLDGKQAKA